MEVKWFLQRGFRWWRCSIAAALSWFSGLERIVELVSVEKVWVFGGFSLLLVALLLISSSSILSYWWVCLILVFFRL